MNLLITGAWQQASEYVQSIREMGHVVMFLQNESDELPCTYEWVEGVIGNGLFLMHPMEKFVNLKYIQLTSAGYDRVPIEYIENHNIEIFNARGVYSIPMAEYVVAVILNIYKHLDCFYQNQHKHIWEKRRDLEELSVKRVCILGCGSVGTECAKRLKSFGCKTIGIDIIDVQNKYFDEIHLMSEMSSVIENADVVVITLPLTEETRHLFDAAMFSKLKDNCVLINIARGKIIDTEALIKNAYRMKAVVLDVFEEEPLCENNVLWDLKNVFITPHNSFVGDKNGIRLSKLIIENLESVEK